MNVNSSHASMVEHVIITKDPSLAHANQDGRVPRVKRVSNSFCRSVTFQKICVFDFHNFKYS